MHAITLHSTGLVGGGWTDVDIQSSPVEEFYFLFV